ncbi:MAG TPA: hypothetical protein DDW24_10110, partial [Blastocatellia bacterium]|nr:hypothetical protein [Blastocatellia bacterium]
LLEPRNTKALEPPVISLDGTISFARIEVIGPTTNDMRVTKAIPEMTVRFLRNIGAPRGRKKVSLDKQELYPI